MGSRGGVMENKQVMSDCLHLCVVNESLFVCSVCCIVAENYTWERTALLVTSHKWNYESVCVVFMLSSESFFHADTHGAEKHWLENNKKKTNKQQPHLFGQSLTLVSSYSSHLPRCLKSNISWVFSVGWRVSKKGTKMY